MKTRKTNEEKSKLITDYKDSGLSMTKWCKANNISASTLSNWLRDKEHSNAESKKKIKFIEMPFIPEPVPEISSVITVEYKSFKIVVPTNADCKSLENILKVVTQLNV